VSADPALAVLESFAAEAERLAAGAARYDWRKIARPEQLAPAGSWRVWLLLAGRGFGKSRTGAEWIREQAESGRAKRIALVAATASDVRDVIVEGESGILAISPPTSRPLYEPSKRRLTWPNGAIATTYSADEPDRLRGPQHDAAWCDELAAWRYPDAWDQLMFGLRLGTDPRVVVTTTPRPTALVRQLVLSASTHVTRGSTYANRANLAPAFFEQIVKRYEGTRLGRQELEAEILDDAPGALWKRPMIEEARIVNAPDLVRVVVAVDPAVSARAASDETGIVVAGVDRAGHGYVLEDLSGRYSPAEWAALVVDAYARHRADRIVAEANQGGALVEANIRTADANASVELVHATRGKAIRAEPVAALYEQRRVHHVGVLAALEDQLTGWDPTTAEQSPDRLDALVWAVTSLLVDGGPPPAQRAPSLRADYSLDTQGIG